VLQGMLLAAGVIEIWAMVRIPDAQDATDTRDPFGAK